MHILVTGAAGMLGRKLTERLVRDGGLNGRQIDKLTLLDVVPPTNPTSFAGKTDMVAADLSTPGKAARAIEDRPDIIFHLAGVVSGEAELDFDKGYRVNLDGTRALLEAIRASGDGYRPRVRLHVVHRGIRRAVPGIDPRRLSSHPADLLRRAEGDRRSAARGLHPARLLRRRRHPAAEYRGASGQAQQGGFGFLLRDHPRAAGRASKPRCRFPRRSCTPMRARAPRSDSSCTRQGLRATRSAPRINLSMPGVCCTVAEQIASLRRIAGERVAARIRRAHDPLVARIVDGWPQRIEARRARELGFKAESSFDEIVRIHIDEDRGGTFVD